jgi:hypothetical protein
LKAKSLLKSTTKELRLGVIKTSAAVEAVGALVVAAAAVIVVVVVGVYSLVEQGRVRGLFGTCCSIVETLPLPGQPFKRERRRRERAVRKRGLASPFLWLTAT